MPGAGYRLLREFGAASGVWGSVPALSAVPGAAPGIEFGFRIWGLLGAGYRLLREFGAALGVWDSAPFLAGVSGAVSGIESGFNILDCLGLGIGIPAV